MEEYREAESAMIPLADHSQYFIKADWKPAMRTAGFQPAQTVEKPRHF